MLLKNLKHFSTDKNINYFCNIPEEKYFAPLRIVYPFIKSLLILLLILMQPFLIDHLINFQKIFVFFELILLLKLISLLSRSVFVTISAISFLLAKFTCACAVSDFKLAKSVFVAKSYVSTPVAF